MFTVIVVVVKLKTIHFFALLSKRSEQEFRKFYTNYHRWDVSYDPSLTQAKIPTETPPDSWDWREHNAVSEIKNQVRGLVTTTYA